MAYVLVQTDSATTPLEVSIEVALRLIFAAINDEPTTVMVLGEGGFTVTAHNTHQAFRVLPSGHARRLFTQLSRAIIACTVKKLGRDDIPGSTATEVVYRLFIGTPGVVCAADDLALLDMLDVTELALVVVRVMTGARVPVRVALKEI